MLPLWLIFAYSYDIWLLILSHLCRLSPSYEFMRKESFMTDSYVNGFIYFNIWEDEHSIEGAGSRRFTWYSCLGYTWTNNSLKRRLSHHQVTHQRRGLVISQVSWPRRELQPLSLRLWGTARWALEHRSLQPRHDSALAQTSVNTQKNKKLRWIDE